MFFTSREKNCEILELRESSHLPTLVHTANVVGECIVFFGGIETESLSSRMIRETTYRGIRVYNADDEEWVSPKIKNEEKVELRHFHTGVVFEESIYYFGGKSKRFYHNDLLRLDVRNMEFKSIVNVTGDIPSPRYGHSSICYKNVMWTHAGLCKNGWTHNDLHSFDFGTNLWTRYKTDILPRRYFHSSIIFEGKLFIINGKSKEGQALSDLHFFDLDTLKSTPIISTPKKKTKSSDLGSWGHNTFIYNKKLYTYGGVTKKPKKKKLVKEEGVKILREYNPNKNVWVKVPFPGSVDSIGFGFGTVTIWRSHKLIFFGGISDSSRDTRFCLLFSQLPNELYRMILSFCDTTSLSRIGSCSKTHLFCLFSSEDRFWKQKYEKVVEHGFTNFGRIFPPSSSSATNSKINDNDCTEVKKLNEEENEVKNYKCRIVSMCRDYFMFSANHFCFSYQKYIVNSENYLGMLQRTNEAMKIIAIGDFGSGKTQFIWRTACDRFFDDYIPTMGMENPRNTFEIPPLSSKKRRTTVELSFWDTAAQDDYDVLRPLSYLQTGGHLLMFLVCFDINYRKSFESVERWVAEAQFFAPNAPMILVGCQEDVMEPNKDRISTEEIQKKAKDLGFYFWNVTSAKTKFGIHRKFLESICICDVLRRDKVFMKMYEKLGVNKLAEQSKYYKGQVDRFSNLCRVPYSFKIVDTGFEFV